MDMKNEEPKPQTLEEVIAEIKAKREEERKQHAETMALLGKLKAGSIFAK